MRWNRRWQHRRHLRLDDQTSWRSILVPAVLGLILVGISYWVYWGLTTPPVPRTVDGSAAIYVDNPQIITQMQVNFDLTGDRQPGRSPVAITLTFFAPPSPPPQATAVRWALVLYRKAKLIEDRTLDPLPEGAKIDDDKEAAEPPLASGGKEPVQVISGTADLIPPSGGSPPMVIRGELPVEVSTEAGSKLALSLPRYGRMQLFPPLQFANQCGAIYIGITGCWSRPDTFQVQVDVDAGPNNADYRLDIASPSIDDPARLEWVSNESVRALLQRTNLREEADQQTLTFILGAVVGAGAASFLTAIERLACGLTRRAG